MKLRDTLAGCLAGYRAKKLMGLAGCCGWPEMGDDRLFSAPRTSFAGIALKLGALC